MGHFIVAHFISTMPYRLRAFFIHLGISSLLIGLIVTTLYFGWYRWPGWYLAGAETVLLILLIVDVGLGPLATFIVANPNKRRNLLKLDLALIAAIQLGALGYGTHTLWIGRPLFYAYTADRFELVPAAAFDAETIDEATQHNLPIKPEPLALPRWIWVPMPEQADESSDIIMSAITTGRDITSMPQYFRPLTEARPNFDRQCRQTPHSPDPDKQTLEKIAAEHGRSPNQLCSIPIEGRARTGKIIFDIGTIEPITFLMN